MYSAMNRVYKHYAINMAATGQKVMPATKVMSFSTILATSPLWMISSSWIGMIHVDTYVHYLS